MTFQELKQLKNDIAVKTGIDTAAAARVIGYYNGAGTSNRPDIIQDMINGDMSPVGPALVALGITPTNTPDNGLKIAPQAHKRTTKQKKSNTSPQAVKGPDVVQGVHDDLGPDDLEHVQGESVNPHELPPGLYDDICALIDNYCMQHDISDPLKIHPLQWQGICYRIGESIKSRRFIHDHAREKIHGGTIYDGEKLAALLDLYGVICSDFKQVAFTFNFARFAGVSTDYLHDYMSRGLTSSRIGLREKALNLQKSSLAGAVTGGGSATVGNIFLSKALAGMSETVTIQHVTTEHAQIIDTVPDLSRAGLPGPV